jgi:tetratricopeptide (TPR) repeat protein
MGRWKRLNSTSGNAAVAQWLNTPSILGSLIAALAFLIYIPTLGFEFVWDDQMQVVSNPLVLSWKMVPRALDSNLWYQLNATGPYYRPFFIIWSILNHSLFGFDTHGWHFLNVLLHAIATGLVFVFLRKLKAGNTIAALAALLFAIHPVHIEPVAWISSGSDSLATVLFLSTFLAYLNFRDAGRKYRVAWLLASFFTFACALLTKEMAITFPAMLFLYEWLFPRGDAVSETRGKLRTAVLIAVPYVLLAGAYLFQRGRVLHAVVQNSGDSINWLVMLQTIPIVVLHYLRILVLPIGLNGFYYTFPVYSILALRFLIPVFGCLAIAALIWYWSRRAGNPLILFFGLWLIVCLAPTLYLRTFPIGDYVRDRYLYLPSIGFVFLLAAALESLGRLEKLNRAPTLRYSLLAALSVAMIAGTISQQIYWTNDLLVFSRGHSQSPENNWATKYLGAALSRRGRPELAVTLLEEAIRKEPRDSYAAFTISMVYSRLGRTEESKEELARAVALNPQYYLATSDGLTNRGIALSSLKQFGEAEECLRKAVQLEPESGDSHYYLGLVLLRTNRPAEAEQQFREAVAINSTALDLHWALGMSRQMQGDGAGALQEYQQELAYHPNNPNVAASERSLMN